MTTSLFAMNFSPWNICIHAQDNVYGVASIRNFTTPDQIVC
jgi:hypothetical protein